MSKDSINNILEDTAKLLRFQHSLGITDYPRNAPIDKFLFQGQEAASSTGPTGGKSKKTSRETSTTLADIEEAWRDCQRCGLHTGRHSIVFGEGDPRAALFILGDHPSQTDDRCGKPFSDEAGDLLTRMLAAIGLQRSEVFITNLVKCHAGGNQPLRPEEIKACLPFLYSQIDIVSPQIICTLGQHAAQALLGSSQTLLRLRGRFHDLKLARAEDNSGPSPIRILPSLHPAFLIKNPEMKKASWEDLQLIQRTLKKRTP